MAEEAGDVKTPARKHCTIPSFQRASKDPSGVKWDQNVVLTRIAFLEASHVALSTNTKANASIPDGEKPGSKGEETKEEQDADGR